LILVLPDGLLIPPKVQQPLMTMKLAAKLQEQMQQGPPSQIVCQNENENE
jgi:hypothetical protein